MSSRYERRCNYLKQRAEQAAIAQTQALEEGIHTTTRTECFDDQQKESLLLTLSTLLTCTTSDGSLAKFLAQSSSVLGTIEYALNSTYLLLATNRGRRVNSMGDDMEEETDKPTELQRLANTIQYEDYDGSAHSFPWFFTARFTLGLGPAVTFSLHRTELYEWCYASRADLEPPLDMDLYTASRAQWERLSLALGLQETRLDELASYLARQAESEFSSSKPTFNVPPVDGAASNARMTA